MKRKDTAENKPLTIDAASGRLAPTPQTIHLKTADDVRLEMAKVYRNMRSGKIQMQDGTRLVFVLSQIGKMIELHEIEKRIIALETIPKGKK